MSVKIYVPYGKIGEYASWIDGAEAVDNIDDCDVVLFTGGEDVYPKLYGQEKGKHTVCNAFRDEQEYDAFEYANKFKKKMLGICRGSQFLCVCAQGELVQHMQHPRHHDIHTWDGKVMQCVSTHHQMQFPYRLPASEYRIIAWADKLSDYYYNGDDQPVHYQGKILNLVDRFAEPEIVHYTSIDALAIQSHPEMMSNTSPFVKYCSELFWKFMNEKLR